MELLELLLIHLRGLGGACEDFVCRAFGEMATMWECPLTSEYEFASVCESPVLVLASNPAEILEVRHLLCRGGKCLMRLVTQPAGKAGAARQNELPAVRPHEPDNKSHCSSC